MLKAGIIGLPNVGKSTLFNALTKPASAKATAGEGKLARIENRPFTTINPNVGIVAVPDDRLLTLTKISRSAKITPTAVEFVDIAGLVRDAHKGEGLGNKFLANIREVDAILHVVRFFEDADITHVDTDVDPKRDIETINTELALADLATVQHMRSTLEKKIRGQDKEAAKLDAVLAKFEEALSAGTAVREVVLEEDEIETAENVHLLTRKPVLYVMNVSEKQLASPHDFAQGKPPLSASWRIPLKEGEKSLSLSIKIEQELVELPDDERQIFLAEYGLHNTGLERLVQASYSLLGLITFFTSGEQESRAWTVQRGAKAPEAAGKIHSDMERGFIRAETVAYKDLVTAGTYANARAAGKVRDEGKEYVVQDGDVMLFKFSA